MKTLGTTVGIDIRDKTIFYKSNKSSISYTIHLQLWYGIVILKKCRF
jgi:hypothetical protein